MSNQQILKTVTSTLLIAGGALANHLEVRRARRDRIVGRVLEFVGELPPAVITQLSTVNPDAWRALLRDLASITRERAADSTDLMSAFAQGVAAAMETATASSAPTSSCEDETASSAERAAVIDLLRSSPGTTLRQLQPLLAEHGPLLATIRLSDILGPTDAEDAPSATSAE